jgi:hypothetical protein
VSQSKKKPTVLLAGVGLIAMMVAGFVFQPWKLFIDTEVQESIPSIEKPLEASPDTPAAEASQEPSATSEESAEDSEELSNSDSDPVVLLQGSLISHEHETSGSVKILQLADGSRILRLENLETSDGPRVEVWLSDAPVVAGFDGWFLFDDGDYASLGAIKGNKGNHNYPIPNDLDLTRFTSVSLWCVTFSVSFGAATLAAS